MSRFGEITHLSGWFDQWLETKAEQGADAETLAKAAEKTLRQLVRKAERLAPEASLEAREPSDLKAIRALRPAGPRVLKTPTNREELGDRLLGAWLGRCAGCVLGIPCEGMTRAEIEAACRGLGQRYPLDSYWRLDPKPGRALGVQYGKTPRTRFLAPGLRCAGADDDLAYTLLGLLVLEESGLDFAPRDVGRAWVRYLPVACTAEKVALDNLKAGLEPPETATKGNPYCEWIGAAIRADPWGYAAPGCLETAAEFAWRDAVVSHTRNGVYGEMYFGAVISAALAGCGVEEALRAGLTEIPRDCRLAHAIRETLGWVRKDADWLATARRIEKRYAGMCMAHIFNNTAITISGLMHGGGDFGRTIAITVMHGVDTDCTAATAGSILGAVLGARRLPRKWAEPMGRHAETYLIGHDRFSHRDVARRFLKIALATRKRAGLA